MTVSAPYRDSTWTPVAFSVSLMLHLILIASVIGFFWKKATPITDIRPVFELVGPPAPSNDSPSPAAAATGISMPNVPAMNYPTITVPSTELPSPVSTLPDPVTTPPPPSQSISKPTPINTHQAKPTPTPATNQPKLMSRDEYLKEFGRSANPAQAANHPAARGVPDVNINANAIEKSLNKSGPGTGSGTASGHNGTSTTSSNNDYGAYLAQRLKEAFKVPDGTSGRTAGIELTISGKGEILKKNIVSKSGNAEFDAAVQDALNRLTNVDPPPSGQEESFSLEFQPNE